MHVKTDPSIIQSYLEDASNLKGGYAREVIIPHNIDDISRILQKANLKKIPVTVSGGGTGQAGARIPFGGMVLSMEKFDHLGQIEKTSRGGCAISEAGVLIADIKRACEKKNLFYTYDPTEQNAFLGGTIATNAAGARSLRYGSTRKNVKRLTVVLPDGTIFTLKRGEIKAKRRVLEFSAGNKHYKIKLPSYSMPKVKNSAGYYVNDDMDLLDLFIGQEGTLCVIVEAELALIDKPSGLFGVFVLFESEKEAQEFALVARNADPLSLEYFNGRCVKLLSERYASTPRKKGAAIFLEDDITKTEDAVLEKWNNILKQCQVSQEDTWVAMTEKGHRDFLDRRHYIPEQMSEMAKHSGFPKVSTDLAVPLDKLADMLKSYSVLQREKDLQSFVFGHIGDGHLHVNMLPRDMKSYERARRLQHDFVRKAVELRGTVSAEHGIGKTRKEFLRLLYGNKGIEEMIEVKKNLDCNMILGVGNIFDL